MSITFISGETIEIPTNYFGWDSAISAVENKHDIFSKDGFIIRNSFDKTIHPKIPGKTKAFIDISQGKSIPNSNALIDLVKIINLFVLPGYSKEHTFKYLENGNIVILTVQIENNGIQVYDIVKLKGKRKIYKVHDMYNDKLILHDGKKFQSVPRDECVFA